MRLADLAPARVAIWGFGREGRATLSAIRRRFPDKPVTVFCDDDEARPVRNEYDADPVTAPADVETLATFDVVIKSPGISAYRAPFAQAEAAGVRFTSGSAIWFSENPDAKTICVTGTKGKSTVTALIAHVLRKGGRRVALAGNIGMALLDLLDAPLAPDWWVIELSSFQTRDFDGAPDVAVVTNLYEEHLDWHVTRERYAADKLKIASRARRVVVPADAWLLSNTAVAGRIVFDDPNSWHVRDGAIFRAVEHVLDVADLPLPGAHNAHNVCAALAAIEAAGEDAIALAAHVRSFKPLPHRLQNLGERDGIRYVNDSISTTPYAAVEALRSLRGRDTVIIVGGFDRGVSWNVFAGYVAEYPPRAVVTMGANGAAIAHKLRSLASPGFEICASNALSDALAEAQRRVSAPGTIVLSPGAPSFDQFRDYAERGREFARLAGFDPSAIAQIDGLGIA